MAEKTSTEASNWMVPFGVEATSLRGQHEALREYRRGQ